MSESIKYLKYSLQSQEDVCAFQNLPGMVVSLHALQTVSLVAIEHTGYKIYGYTLLKQLLHEDKHQR